MRYLDVLLHQSQHPLSGAFPASLSKGAPLPMTKRATREVENLTILYATLNRDGGNRLRKRRMDFDRGFRLRKKRIAHGKLLPPGSGLENLVAS
jgi:hypothetical protein